MWTVLNCYYSHKNISTTTKLPLQSVNITTASTNTTTPGPSQLYDRKIG